MHSLIRRLASLPWDKIGEVVGLILFWAIVLGWLAIGLYALGQWLGGQL